MRAFKRVSLFVLAIFFVLVGLEGNGPSALLHFVSKTWRNPSPTNNLLKVGIWSVDDHYGYAHVPNAVGQHHTAQYKVTYQIGSRGERLHPQTEREAEKEVVFLGGSCTFGQGVESNQAFPAILAREYWQDWRVRNQAVIGWGTSHAYLRMEEELKHSDPPDAFIYVMIPHHITRNSLSEPWLRGLHSYGMKHPHFSEVNNELVYNGVVGLESALPRSAQLREQELAISIALLRRMKDECEKRGLEFCVVLLPKMLQDQAWSPTLIRGMVENSIQIHDLSELELIGFEGDSHPNPADHRRIADQLKQHWNEATVQR